MAKSKLQQFIERTPILRRSGDLAAWSWPATGAIVAVRLILGLIVDPSRVQNFSPLWGLIAVMTIAGQVAFVWLLMFAFMLRVLKKRLAPFMNIAVLAVAGGTANVLIGVIASSWGLDHWDKPEFRFLGGVLINVALFVLGNNLVGAYREQARRVRDLRIAEDRLQGVRESSAQMIADEQEVLQKMTQGLLLPPIEKISAELGRESVLSELRAVITNEVRPLSNEILTRAAILQDTKEFEEKLPKLRPRWISKFDLAKSLRPWSAFTILVIAIPLSMYLIIDHRSIFRGIMATLFASIFVQIIKWVLPRNRPIATGVGILAQAAISALAVLPGLYVFYLEHGPIIELIPASIAMVLLSIFTTFFLAYARGLDNNRREFEDQLRNFNEQLAIEVALFEQKLWLDRRSWSFLIHGTVQSSLTAALLRLQAADADQTVLDQVREDLNKAKAALLEAPARQGNISESIRDLEQTWGGICKIETVISSAALQTLNASNDATLSVNEIAKEAVSNAIRHASANEISITIDKVAGQIQLRVENNGVAYSSNAQTGLGSRMISDLTLNWSIKNLNGKTVLLAVIPVAAEAK